MYGLMLNVLRDLVMGQYGEHYWKDICRLTGLSMEEGAFLAKKCYEEKMMTQLIDTTAAVLGIHVDALLELFGEQHFKNMKTSGHYKVVRCLGYTLEGFLHNLDTLHDHIAIAYPEIRAPSFRTEKTQTGLLLHYYSCRKGLYPVVIGTIKAIAKEFYHLVVDMNMVSEEEEEEGSLMYHYLILIEPGQGRRNIGRLRGNSIIPEIVALPSVMLNDSDASLSEAAELDESPGLTPQAHKKEERSQSTGQMIQRERSNPSTSPLPVPDLEALTKICPFISGQTETTDEGEEEDRDDEATPVPLRQNLISSTPSSSPRQSPTPPVTPQFPRRVSFLPGSPTLHRVMSSAHERRQLRSQVSQTSLPGTLPRPLLPSLRSYSQLSPMRDSQAVGVMNFDTNWPITEPLFQMCFPFHLIIDVQLTIRYMGASMARLLPNAIACEEKITDHFKLIRPIASFTYYTVRHSIHNPFILELKQPQEQGAATANGRPLQFRGQMVPVLNAERCPILFLASPRIETVEELTVKGLYLTDLPIHDVTRDLILLSQHFRAEVNLALQLERTKHDLEQEKMKVQEEKQRVSDLLHAMLPPSVAKKLTSCDGRSEQMVIAEEVQMVTILFSDIRDFTTICHRCSPMDVVSMLNDLYTKFDSFIDKHKVYKVETIGDAYMVAAGLLDTSPRHAEAVTNMAFDMRQAASLVTTPHTSECIQIRIGIHTGMVVAGVVGTKMPRYCLFGDTVNTASRMESHGEPGRVHISQMTYKKLRGRPYIFWNRGKIRVKGLPDLQQTYFVEPGEGHELVGATRIMIEPDSSPDSEWDENEIVPFRKSRNPSFVRYKHMQVVMPTPIGTPAHTSFSSVLDEPRRPNRTSRSSHSKFSMRDRLSGTPSVGSYSFSHSLSSFLEQEQEQGQGMYRELGVDVGVSGSHLTAPLGHRKVSSRSVTGMVILAEPEGDSVTFTREPDPGSPSLVGDELKEEEEDVGEGEYAGLRMRVESDSVVKSKKHKSREKLHKNKCKVS